MKGFLLDLETACTLSPLEYDNYLKNLEEHECWVPLFEILEERLKGDLSHQELRFLRKALQINAFYLKDEEKTTSLCAKAITEYNFSFQDFQKNILDPLAQERSDYDLLTLIETVYKNFSKESEQIFALEYLVSEWDKKPNSFLSLERVVQTLFTLQAENPIALQFLKQRALQDGNFAAAKEILLSLLRSKLFVKKYQAAFELADIYISHTNEPQKGVYVLTEHCKDAPIDPSYLLFQGFYSLRNWQRCIEICAGLLKKAKKRTEKALLYHRLGELHLKINEYQKSASHFLTAYDTNPTFLKPIEELVYLSIDQKDWPMLIECLRRLVKRSTPEATQYFRQVLTALESNNEKVSSHRA